VSALLSPINDRDRLTLEVGGVVYGGWKSARVQHGIEQLAGAFSLVVSDVWPDQEQGWSIAAGDSCTIKIGGEPVITGFVDAVKVSADAHEHAINIQGRDAAGDLVDCSAPPKEWINQTFEAITRDLLSPYGIKLFTQVPTGAGQYQPLKRGKNRAPHAPAFNGGAILPRKACNPGETVHRLLERLAKLQGVLLVSDRRGGLMITRSGLNGRADDTLVLGQNILKIDYERSFANVFSEITVKGQAHGATSATGSTMLSTASTVKPVATIKRAPAQRSETVRSPLINRGRPLLLLCDDQADATACATRAAWESATREARSQKVTVLVQGWRQSTGKLWEINTEVFLKSRFTRSDKPLIISALEYSLDGNGTTCQMTLYPPEAYEVLKEIPRPEQPKASTALPSALSKARE
jgi:prophage tail gpP-like protein